MNAGLRRRELPRTYGEGLLEQPWAIIEINKRGRDVTFFFESYSWFLLLLLLFSCSVMSSSLGPHGLASLSFSISRSLLKLMSVESVMPSNHLILCRPLRLPPSVFPRIRVFLMSQLFASGGQSVGASASVLLMDVLCKSLQSCPTLCDPHGL